MQLDRVIKTYARIPSSLTQSVEDAFSFNQGTNQERKKALYIFLLL